MRIGATNVGDVDENISGQKWNGPSTAETLSTPQEQCETKARTRHIVARTTGIVFIRKKSMCVPEKMRCAT